MGIGIGAAMAGLRPVIELMTVNFSIVAMDQIINNASKVRYMFGGQVSCPMVHPHARRRRPPARRPALPLAGGVVLPRPRPEGGLPRDPQDAKGLLKASIRDDDPVIFLESEGLYAKKGPVGGPDELVPLGRAAVRRRGDDCTVVAISRMVWTALVGHRRPGKEGIECDVIDPRSLRPLDLETIAASVRRTGRAVIVEEGWPECGVAANLATRIYESCFDWLDAPDRARELRRRPDALREEPRAVRPALAPRRDRARSQRLVGTKGTA